MLIIQKGVDFVKRYINPELGVMYIDVEDIIQVSGLNDGNNFKEEGEFDFGEATTLSAYALN